MPYGTKYDRKLGKWIVYVKATGKVIGKHDTQTQAEKQKTAILINEHNPAKRK